MSNDRIPKWGRKASPPPEIEEGERVVVVLDSVKDAEGQFGPQYQFDGVIEGTDYNARAWVKKYDVPTSKTKIYRLGMLVETYLGRQFNSVDDMVKALETEVQKVYFLCSGHREADDGTLYPKFAVVASKLPVPQSKIEASAKERPKADTIIDYIAQVKPVTRTDVEDMVAEEMARSGNMFGEDVAAYLVAKSLGVDLKEAGLEAE